MKLQIADFLSTSMQKVVTFFKTFFYIFSSYQAIVKINSSYELYVVAALVQGHLASLSYHPHPPSPNHSPHTHTLLQPHPFQISTALFSKTCRRAWKFCPCITSGHFFPVLLVNFFQVPFSARRLQIRKLFVNIFDNFK